MIAGSVGQGGANRRGDAISIQGLLNDLRTADGLLLLRVDGVAGPKTIGAIIEFQKKHPGLARDGRIDPNGATMAKLDESCANLYGSIAFVQLSTLFDQLRLGTGFNTLRPRTTLPVQRVRGVLATLRPQAVAPGVNRFVGTPALPFLRSPLLAAVLVAPIVVVLVFLLLMLVVITSNPIWQRAAREMVKGIEDRMRLMSQALRDAIQSMIDEIEDALRDTPCAKLCLDERGRLQRLFDELKRLLDSMPANDNDPEALKGMKFRIVRLQDEILKAREAIIECLARSGC